VLLEFRLFEELVDAGVYGFQISLDGLEAEHDKTRIQGNGAGTYDTIMRNILAVRNSTKSFEVLLRLHLHAQNIASIERLIEFLGEQILSDSRFKISVHRVFDYGWMRKRDFTLNDKDAEAGIQSKLANTFPSNQILTASKVAPYCYASLPNHFVIRANGKIQKCTVALYDEQNDVGQLLPDGTIKWFDQKRLLAWSEGVFSGDEDHMRCPLKAIKTRRTAGL
jgi:uncharacterized protein